LTHSKTHAYAYRLTKIVTCARVLIVSNQLRTYAILLYLLVKPKLATFTTAHTNRGTRAIPLDR